MLAYTPPAGWGFPTIEEIASPEKSAIRIGPFGSALKKHEYSESGVRVLGIEDVFPNKLVSDNPKYIPEIKYRELSQYTVKHGDILITNMGTVGRTCVVPDGLENSIISSHLIKVSMDLHEAWPPYISWMLNFCPLVTAQIKSKSHGAIMAGFNTSLLKQLRIPLPPLTEQRRIAEILDRAEVLRAKCRTALAQLDTLTQAIFLDLFGDPVTNPKGWPLVPLTSVIYFQEGPGVRNWQFRKEGIKLINVGNIVDGRLVPENTNRYLDPLEVEQRYKHFLLDVGDFVVASSGVTWGKIAEVEKSHLPLCLNTSMIRFRPLGSGMEKRFIRAFVESSAFRRQILRLITGSAQPNFGPAHLKQVQIHLPPQSLQREFSRRIAIVEKLKAAHRASLLEMDALFTSLQHRAFRGEL